MIRDHQRAILAERHVRAMAEGSPPEERKAYGAICMKLPILVHQAGLAPALHHVAQLTRPGKGKILDHLAEQLVGAGLLGPVGGREALLTHSREVDAPSLVTVSREVRRCLDWYRRFAKTLLHADPAEEDG